MTGKELIYKLLEHPIYLNEEIIVQKEIGDNIWINSDLNISYIGHNGIVCTIDFPVEKFEIKRKEE